MVRMRIAAAVFSLAALAACEGDSPVTCPDMDPPMMLIQVTDASTGNPAAEGTTGSITEGAFTSPLVRYGEDRLAPQTTGRPGTYTVTLQRAGFQTWTRTGVRVDAAECGTETVHLDAFLVPG